MKKLTLILISIFFFIETDMYGQNLVPNYSFEIYDTCPEVASQIHRAEGWWQPTLGTSDYFNSCDTLIYEVNVPSNVFGYQNAKSGNGYGGFYTAYYFPNQEEYREYIQTKLVSNLVLGTKYYVSFYISLSDSSNWAVNKIGAYFSEDSVYSTDWENLNYTPQVESEVFITDKTNWVLISGEFIANGDEKYLTIGNFNNNSSTDTISVSGGGNVVGGAADYYSYYYIDDICVSSEQNFCDVNVSTKKNKQKNSNLSIYPNPAKNKLNILAPFNSKNATIKIYNSIGVLVINEKMTSNTINVGELSDGVYILHIHYNDEIYTSKFLIHK